MCALCTFFNGYTLFECTWFRLYINLWMAMSEFEAFGLFVYASGSETLPSKWLSSSFVCMGVRTLKWYFVRSLLLFGAFAIRSQHQSRKIAKHSAHKLIQMKIRVSSVFVQFSMKMRIEFIRDSGFCRSKICFDYTLIGMKERNDRWDENTDQNAR